MKQSLGNTTDLQSRMKTADYQKAFSKFGANARSLRWKSEKAAKLRYEQFMKDLDFEGKSILDVGCGFGDIIPFIQAKTETFTYTGYDLVPEFISIAKEKYQKYNFIVGDYFSHPSKHFFDIIMSCGTLNSNMSNALEFRKRAIQTMFDHANEAVIFNMAGNTPAPESTKRILYADILGILEFCFTLTSKVILRNNYHKKDFTIVMFK